MRNIQEYDIQPKKLNLQRSSPIIHQETNEQIRQTKESFKDLIENTVKTESRKNSKQKLRLPNINKNLISDQESNNLQLSGKPLKMFNQRNDKEKMKQNFDEKEDSFQNQIKGAKLLINIKAVKSSVKNSQQKNNDRSLRDLRMLKRQQNIQSSQGKKQNKYLPDRQSNTTSVSAVSKSKKSQKIISKLKQQRRSSQKLKINRQTKSFSISNNKKKFSISYLDFCLFISLLNNFNKLPDSNSLYKAFVAKGNNSILIKNAIKTRFWWNITQNQVDVNLVWSQNRRSDLIQSFIKFQQKRPGTNSKCKKYRFHLQNKGDQKFNDNIKQFTKIGFLRLVSQKQVKQTSSTAYFSEIAINQNSSYFLQSANKIKTHNHLQFNWHLTNKKALYYNLKSYYIAVKEDPFVYIPLTFHIKQEGDNQWNNFIKSYEQRILQYNNCSEKKQIKKNKKKKQKQKQKEKSPLWIIKPGQNSNQGCGIQVSDSLEEIKGMINSKNNLKNGKNRSHIIQRYLMPFLYNKRKFDIRCYILVTSVNSVLKCYWYQQGYIRTSSKQFTTKNLKNRMIHLTNDAIQKKGQDYGKYQNANKISFTDFQKYLDNNFMDRQLNFFKTVYPQMMKQAADAMKATYSILDHNKREFTFQIFGLDFMIDQDFKTWLIEINNNPCLQLCSPLLARIIPNMIQNAFKIALDPLFPPPASYSKAKIMATDLFQSNKFTLIFNSSEVQKGLQVYLSQNKNLGLIVESDQESEQMEEEECNFQKKQQY